jgi:hypothetical protein
MQHATTVPAPERTCSRGNCATLFVSLELSRSTWVATALAPGSTKTSKHTLVGGDGRKLLDLLARLETQAEQRIAAPVKVVTIHEVGLDGFWIHRLLEANGVESHRPRTVYLEDRQSASAHHNGRACLDVGEIPACQCSQLLVPPARWLQARPNPPHLDRSAGPQTTRRPREIRQPW